MLGTCKYCGQVIEVFADTEEAAAEAAWRECDCEGAAQAREIEKAKEPIGNLFGPDNHLGARPIGEKQADCLYAAAEFVVRTTAHSVQVDLGGGTTAKVGRNTKGNIEIKRSDKVAAKLEL